MPSIICSKSIKQRSIKSSTILDHSNNIHSRRSTKSFRNYSTKNLNPIIPSSNQSSSIKLTSFRKINDQNTKPNTLSFQSNSNSSFNLFPNQSYSDINYNYSTRSNSSYDLSQQENFHSLPNISLQRSNSTSVININQIDSSKLLCSTSDQTDNDSVLTMDENEIIQSSTFIDSSMKSKVLQASFRGKVHTMNRRRTKSTTLPNDTNQYFSIIQSNYPTTTTTDNKITDVNQPCTYSYDSVFNFTLKLQEKSTTNIQRRHTISNDNIRSTLLKNFNNNSSIFNFDENTTNNNYNQSTQDENSKQEYSLEYDRLQNNSFNSQTIE